MFKLRSYIIILIISSIFVSCYDPELGELAKGKYEFEREDYKTAIEYFNKTLKNNPKNSEALLYLGRSYLEMDESHFQEALENLEKSIKYKGDNPDAYLYLGDAYHQKAFDEFILSRIFHENNKEHPTVSEEAIACYQKAINLNPNYALPYLRIGFYYGFWREDIVEAISWYKKGIAIDDNFGNVYLQLGRLYLKNNDLDKAIDNFNKEIENVPTSLDAYFEASKVYIRKGEYQKAQKYLNYIVSQNPNFPQLNYYLAIAYQNSDYDKSLDNMKAAARLGDERAKDWLGKNKLKW